MGIDSKSNAVQRKRKQRKKASIGKNETVVLDDASNAKLSNFPLYFVAVLATISFILFISLTYAVGNDVKHSWSTKFLELFNFEKRQEKVRDWKTKTPHEDGSLWILDRRSNLSLSEFIQKYDGRRPVIITDALTGWKANNWSKEFFVKNYGDQQVVMKAVQGTLQQAESLALPVKLFGQHSNEGSPKTWTYLQDELFIQLHPELREHLGKLIYLEEDFFQLFPAEVRPWNAMLLWGTPYSRSYLHIDPYNWTGTNAVFSGKKLWKLYPPGQDEYLYVMRDRKSEFPLNCFKYNSRVDAFSPDLKKYPRFTKARAISFTQNPGELLIIPPGWFHQAFNEIETIAVSSQVMNSQNYHIILEEIFKAGNIDQKNLPSNFHELPAVDQVLTVMRSLPPSIITRGKTVTADILKQMGYPPN